ncbi:DUF4229 domain-containing protein [Allostreptomyces psammosilenae]|uniref:Bacteriorhodopsin n=1 Tax=Allostreptomyces psammosilenae TaxID=1892865 RepID=A0A852ZTT8_9ACTN|nr:DUF4229 domain-containing protein [Allostreptomyces psammosilenae]NYI05816.1 bacteriorhodopsin [Allostreptomyces psammosilenae]
MKTSNAALRYTALRFAIFLGCFAVVWLLGYVGVLPVSGESGAVFLLLLALVISAPISYVVLSRQRDAMSAQISERVSRTRNRLAADAAGEDAADEAARRAAAREAGKKDEAEG